MINDELKGKLKDLVALIEHNLDSVDNFELIALNIATNVRVLVHDTAKSTSLLKMM